MRNSHPPILFLLFSFSPFPLYSPCSPTRRWQRPVVDTGKVAWVEAGDRPLAGGGESRRLTCIGEAHRA
jgi:hypothetical protein